MSAAGPKIAIAGNPNSGKTTIFNALTGARQHVGNWPGVTVERKDGHFSHTGETYTVVDLPGIYSLSSYSIEETIARQYIIDEHPDVVIDIVDASNLHRNLYLTTQLIELGAPLVVVLNMMDMATEKGLEIDADTLAILLGAPVVKVVGRTGQGLPELKAAIAQVASVTLEMRQIAIPYPRELEGEITAVTAELDRLDLGRERLRWRAVKLLERDQTTTDKISTRPEAAPLLERIDGAIKNIEAIYHDSSRAIISQARHAFIQGALRECVRESAINPFDYSRRIDKILTNRWLGLPLFGILLWIMFQLTYKVGAYPMEWIDAGVSGVINLIHHHLPPGWLTSLVADGIVGGVGAIAVFLPNIFILFFIIALFEDSGYMARVAFIMDRVMHAIGLHGKAFVPMVMGFGCNVPAIMGTRILETRRDRILSILINPFMSCSARFPVYVLVAGAFFPTQAGTVIFGLYVLGILVAILSGKLFSKTLLSGISQPFVMELPPYQWPTGRSLLLHTWERGAIFIRKMGTVILVGSLIIWALGYFPRNITLSPDFDRQQQAAVTEMETTRAEVAARFEHSVADGQQEYTSTLLPYEQSAAYQTLVAQRQSLLMTAQSRLDSSLAAIEYQRLAATMEQKWIGRLGKIIEPVLAPLGFTWREGVALATGFIAKEIVVSTYGVLFGVGTEASADSPGIIANLHRSGMRPLVALAFLVFTLLYTPCLATVAAIRRETGSWGYSAFSVAYSLAVAWLLSFAIYRVGTLLHWLT